MTREQIEKEAMEYAERIPQSDERREYSREDFIAGAQWLADHLCHLLLDKVVQELAEYINQKEEAK